MNKKRILLAALIGVSLLSTTTHAEDKFISAIANPIQLFLNGKSLPVEELQPVIINNRTYVPLRPFAEQLGALVGYDPDSHSVYLHTAAPLYNRRSALTASSANDLFELKLHSAKTTYQTGEPLSVWSTLTSLAEDDTTVYGGPTDIVYSISDAQGKTGSMSELLSLETKTYRKDDAVLSSLPPHVAFLYSTEGDSRLWDKSLGQLPILPKGTYTISARSSYTTELFKLETKQTLQAELTITVE